MATQAMRFFKWALRDADHNFVDCDEHSGMPSKVSVDQAFDFGSEEAARVYANRFPIRGYIVTFLTCDIEYEYDLAHA